MKILKVYGDHVKVLARDGRVGYATMRERRDYRYLPSERIRDAWWHGQSSFTADEMLQLLESLDEHEAAERSGREALHRERVRALMEAL